MKDEQIEVIKEVDFKEIKRKIPFLNTHNAQALSSKEQSVKDRPDISESSKEIQEQKEMFDQETQQKASEAIKQIQEKIEKIQNTAIYIKLVEEEGTTRAQIRHRITNQVLAVIPWHIRKDMQGMSSCVQLQDYFGSFYGKMSMGGCVDKAV